MPFHFAVVLFFALTAIGFVLAMLVAGRFLRPHAPSAEKSMIYECGEKPLGHAWSNFNARFYLVALVIVVFEVEIALMFPVAAVYRSFVAKGEGLLVFAEISVFVGILAVGLAYVWAMGDLDWVKSLKQDLLRASPVSKPEGPERKAA